MSLFVYVFLFLFYRVNCHNLLVINPSELKYHVAVGDSIVKHLLVAGHGVTYLSPKHYKNNDVPKLKQIIYKVQPAKQNADDIASFDVPVQKFLTEKKNKFDAVIALWDYNELLSGVSQIFGSPLIWVVPAEPQKAILQLVSNSPDANLNWDLLASILPGSWWKDLVQLSVNDKEGMSFLYENAPTRKEQILYQELFDRLARVRGAPLLDYSEARRRASMELFVTHPIAGLNHPMPHNAKYIGGIHIDDNAEQLPEDLLAILDVHQHGVVYCSVNGDDGDNLLPPAAVDDLVKVFKEMEHTVFWETSLNIKNMPSNVIVRKSMPQTAILAHQNTRVFITNAGQYSVNEALHYGLPIITLPHSPEQRFYSNMASHKGYGIEVELNNPNMPQYLKRDLKEILTNASYTEKVQNLSQIYHDRVLSPGEEMVHWVDFVIRTNGAPHLKSKMAAPSLYELMALDLVAILLGLYFIILFSSYRLFKQCFKLFYHR